MSSEDSEICDFCRTGHITKCSQEMAFHQSTDKGYVFCRLIVPVSICDQCGLITSDPEAEAIIEEAVRREYDKLP